MQDLPEPAVEWVAFSSAISALNDRTPLVWDPITKKINKKGKRRKNKESGSGAVRGELTSIERNRALP